MRRASLAILFVIVFIDLIGFGMVIPFLSFYAREYGASGTTVGMVVGIYSIMQFFFAPVWGRLSDRIGRRPVILISLTASCLGYFLFAFSRSLALLFASRIIAGAGLAPQFDARVWREMTAHATLLAIMATLFITLLAVAGMETSVTLHARDRF